MLISQLPHAVNVISSARLVSTNQLAVKIVCLALCIPISQEMIVWVSVLMGSISRKTSAFLATQHARPVLLLEVEHAQVVRNLKCFMLRIPLVLLPAPRGLGLRLILKAVKAV